MRTRAPTGLKTLLRRTFTACAGRTRRSSKAHLLRRVSGWLGVLLLSLLPILALSQPRSHLDDAAATEDERRGKGAWHEGRRLFDEGDVAAALEQFTRGYRETGKEGFLYNMIVCATMLDDRSLTEKLVAAHSSRHPDGKHVADIAALCRSLALDGCPSSAPPQSDLTAPSAPPTEGLFAPPLSVALDAGTPRGSITPLDAIPPPVATTPFYKDWPFWAAVSVTVVAGIVTAVVLSVNHTSGPADDYIVDLR